jgi:hypothetical protein
MIFNKMRRNAGVVLGGILLIVLAFFLIESLTVPVYGRPGGPKVLCGTGTCLCYCEASDLNKGSCDCMVIRGVGCSCYCTGGDSDECEIVD